VPEEIDDSGKSPIRILLQEHEGEQAPRPSLRTIVVYRDESFFWNLLAGSVRRLSPPPEADVYVDTERGKVILDFRRRS
jgi:hypothetical protein